MILYETVGNLIARPLLRRLLGCSGEGWSHIPAAGPAVIAASHDSLIDPFVLGCATRRGIHYMAKAELWNHRLLGMIMDGFGAFPVERGRADRSAVESGRKLLERGELIGMFPQGTTLPYRNRPWLRGAARLALESGAPLIPVAIVNTEKVLRPNKVKIGIAKVWIHVAEPIVPDGAVTVHRARELTDEVRRRVEELRAPYGPPAHVWLD